MCSRFLKLNTLILLRVIKEMMTMQHAKENQSEQIRWDIKANPLMRNTNDDISWRGYDENTKYLELSFTFIHLM